MKKLLKVIGPGLLFASTAIGTSHFVLATRAGAHYGLIFLFIILGIMVAKYPFYEFAVRYANATGESLLEGYLKVGKWALALILGEIAFLVFAVIGALSSVTAALLSTSLGLEIIPMSGLIAIIMVLTILLLLFGGYSSLDNFIKILSVILLITVTVAFVVALFGRGQENMTPASLSDIFSGPGLALTISLMGFMPAGLELSIFNSLWSVEKAKTTGYRATFRESLIDFHLGYAFTTILAIMFLAIGAFTVYGTGQTLEGNSIEFTERLISVFTRNLGTWAAPLIAITAFGTIYGSLITVWDGAARVLTNGLPMLKNHHDQKTGDPREGEKRYGVILVIIGLLGFLLCYQFANEMIQMLELVTISIFIVAPLIGFLNILVIKSKGMPETHKPSKGLLYLAYFGLIFMLAFAVYYLVDLILFK